MAFKLANRVKMTVSGTPGTGTITLGSAITGYVSFAVGGISDGDTVSYVIEDTGGAWEIGTGTYTASGTLLARTTVTASSAGGTTKISATSGALVFIAPLAADLQSTDTLTSGTLSVGRGGTGITSLTAGYIPFGAGASPFGSSADLFWDSANARLGIGTSSPTQKLDVNGSIAITAAGARIVGDFINATVANRVLFQSSSANTNTSVGSIPNGTGTAASFVSINNSDPANSAYLSITATSTDARLWSGIVGSGTYLPVTFFAGGSERMRIDSSGNVGIGTTSISDRLSVSGNISATNASYNYVKLTSGTVEAQLAANGGGTVDLRAQSNNPLAIYTNGTERMRIDSSGNVGIGTASPASKLDVTSSTNSSIILIHTALTGSGATDGFELSVGDTASWVWNYENTPIIFGANDAERMRIAANGNIGIGTSSPNTKFVVSDNAVVPTTTQTGRVAHFVGSDTATARILIDSIASAVNISTRRANGTAASPSALLTGETLLNMGSFGYGATGYAAGARASITSTIAENWTDSAQGAYWTFSTTAIGSTTLTERMRIDANGNVGIGTTSISDRLTVSGNISATTATYCFAQVSSGTVQGQLAANSGGSVELRAVSNHPLVFFTNNTERMRIGSSGNVSIGTTAENARLTVVGSNLGATATNTTNLAQFYSNTGNGDAFEVLYSRNASSPTNWTTADLIIRRNVDSTANQQSIRFNGDASIAFTTVGTERMRINSSGNVGIATASPAHKLSIGAQIGGTSTATPDAINIGSTYSNTAGANAKLRLFWDGLITYGLGVSASQLDYIISQSGSHVWYINGSERMRIDSSGRIGIGTSPYNILDVYRSSNGVETIRINNDNAGASAQAQITLQSNASQINIAQGSTANNGGYGIMDIGTAGDFFFRKVNASGSFVWTTGGYTERMRIDSSGNVGIATSSPGSKLHIEQTGISTTTTVMNTVTEANAVAATIFDFDQYTTVDGGGSSMLRFRKANGTKASPTVVGANRATGRVGSQIYDGTAFYDNGLILFSADGTPATGSTPGRIQFYTTASGSTTLAERMRIDSSGNVGIGTTSIGAKFDIVVSIPAGGSSGTRLTGGSLTSLWQLTGSAYSYNGVGANEVLFYGAGGPLSLLADGQPIKFCSGGERMRITSAGNIHTPAGSTGMTNGFFYMPAAAGAPSGTPTSISGTVPFYYDTTNNQFYVYNGSWKKVALT